MNKVDIQNTIVKSISKYCNIEKQNIYEDAILSEYIHSSIEFIKIIVDLEDTYDIVFINEELKIDNFKTISDLVEFVGNKLK